MVKPNIYYFSIRLCDLSKLFFLNYVEYFPSIQILPPRVPFWFLKIFAYYFVRAIRQWCCNRVFQFKQ